MLKRFEITSAEQAKIVAHPLRLQIISLFDDQVSRTSKQLADLLDLSPAKVHYHVRELARVGILELVETKEKGGVIEKYYLPVAEQFHIKLNDAELSVEEQNSTRHQFLKNILEDFCNSFITAAEVSDRKKAERRKEQQEIVENELRVPSVSLTHLMLTDNDIRQLQRELEELFERWDKKGREQQNGGNETRKSYGLLLSLYEKTAKTQKGYKRMTID